MLCGSWAIICWLKGPGRWRFRFRRYRFSKYANVSIGFSSSCSETSREGSSCAFLRMRRKRSEAAAQKKERLLRAAVTLAIEERLSALTHRRLAAAGAPLTTVTYHSTSKTELLIATAEKSRVGAAPGVPQPAVAGWEATPSAAGVKPSAIAGEAQASDIPRASIVKCRPGELCSRAILISARVRLRVRRCARSAGRRRRETPRL